MVDPDATMDDSDAVVNEGGNVLVEEVDDELLGEGSSVMLK